MKRTGFSPETRPAIIELGDDLLSVGAPDDYEGRVADPQWEQYVSDYQADWGHLSYWVQVEFAAELHTINLLMGVDDGPPSLRCIRVAP